MDGLEIVLDESPRSVRVTSPISVPFPAKGQARALRDVIRDAVAALEVPNDQAIAAVFRGARPRGADVENLLLHNIDQGGRLFDRGAGVRFEHGLAHGDGFVYEYAVTPPTLDFAAWRTTHTLANWGFAPLEPGPSRWLLARTWWALAQASAEQHRAVDGPFACAYASRRDRCETPSRRA